MANIYELKNVYLNLQEHIKLADDEAFESILETIDDEIENKAEAYACIIKNTESDIEGIKAEEQRLKEMRKGYEARIKRLKDTLFNCMKETGKTKFKTKLFNFSIQKNGGALPVMVDVDTSKLKDEFVIVTEKPDLNAIAKYIEETGDVSFAHLGERGESLRIK